MNGRRLVAAALLLVLVAARARADGLDAVPLRPPTDPFGHIALAGAESLAPGEVFAAAHLGIARGVYPVRRAVDGRKIATQLDAVDAAAGVGVWRPWRGAGLTLGVGLPIVYRQRGAGDARPGEDVAPGGLGSLRLEAKMAFHSSRDDPIGPFARVRLRVPTGRDEDLRAEGDGLALDLEVGAEVQLSLLRLAATVGYGWLEGRVRLDDLIRDDELRLGLAASVAPLIDVASFERFELTFEVRHAFRIADPYRSSDESPLALALGARLVRAPLFLLVAGSWGLWRSPGEPQRQLVLGAGVVF